jgi:glycosyltransferase involved in cell wall biosynthesis
MAGDVTSAVSLKNDRFTITYTGTFYQERSPYPIFRALRGLVDRGDVDLARIKIDLIGWCETAEGRSVKKMAEEYGLSGCVNIVGPLGRILSLRRLVQSDLLLLLAEGLTLQIPGKTYEYLRAGRPILALTSGGALADLLRKAGGAWVVDPVNDNAVLGALREAYHGWNDGAVAPEPDRAVVADFDRRQLAGRFAELFVESRVARAE